MIEMGWTHFSDSRAERAFLLLVARNFCYKNKLIGFLEHIYKDC